MKQPSIRTAPEKVMESVDTASGTEVMIATEPLYTPSLWKHKTTVNQTKMLMTMVSYR